MERKLQSPHCLLLSRVFQSDAKLLCFRIGCSIKAPYLMKFETLRGFFPIKVHTQFSKSYAKLTMVKGYLMPIFSKRPIFSNASGIELSSALKKAKLSAVN